MDAGFDLIAFDGDDTLWHNERSYRAGRETFRRVLLRAGVAIEDDELEAVANRIEVRNIPYYGYGVSSFVLSLIETAVELTGGRIAGGDIRELIEQGKRMLTEEVELFAGAREAVQSLGPGCPLMLITKGDLLHQTSKMERSGLRPHFSHVEVVSEKSPAVYREILDRYRIEPARFLMVGNSVRSDILPVLELGGWAVHVPAELSWAYEHGEVPAAARHRYTEIDTLHELAAAVERLKRRGTVS